MVFATQVVSVTIVVVADELTFGTHGRNAELLSAVLGRIAPVPIFAATSAMILLEGVRNLMVLSNYLHNRFVQPLIEKRKEEMQRRLDESRAQGLVEGIAQGKAKADADWQLWNQRRLEAESKGEPFTEPPPSGHNGSSPSSC